MSAQEIIAELAKLKPEEFRLVQAKVEDLAKTKRRTIGEVVLDFAGTAEGLSGDSARNHDQYLRVERVAGRLILAGSRIVRQAEVEAILECKRMKYVFNASAAVTRDATGTLASSPPDWRDQ